tara:strand:- start:687 stop:899 length:213 start_codon:yes stop_codon:yes gene_type:complete
MKIDIKKGSLVKNIRSDEIGMIIEENIEINDSQYYKVLLDGKIVSWFKPNIETVENSDERTHRDSRRHLA